MNARFARIASVASAFCLVALATTAQQAAPTRSHEVTEVRSPQGISWQPSFAWDEARITVAGPPGDTSWTVPAAAGTLQLAVEDLQMWSLLTGTSVDGPYNYELRFTPVVDPALRAELDRLRSDADGAGPVAPEMSVLPVVCGAFRVVGGNIIGTTAGASEAAAVAKDVLHYDDVITTGSLCVGFDCINGESFGYCTTKLKENNLQLCFEDTSIGSFPTNDWKIQINDTTSGGGSYFAIWDVDAGRIPFRIEAGAPANSLYVEDYGRVGFGTSIPYVELHIVDGDSPTVRLDQDGSSGWAAQSWDMVGNETNFFIRDVTNGSKLSFRIQPNTPSNTLTMRSSGNVGIGTWSPAAPLEIETTGRNAELRLDRTDGGEWSLQSGPDKTFTIGLPDGGQTFLTLHSTGAVKTSGPVNGLSDRNAKQDFAAVNRASLLNRLAVLDVSEWSYISEGSGVRHIGPTAQDFRAAFGLGDDDTHISLSDLSGVALAAIQELHLRLAQRDREIAELRRRLEALEATAGQTH
jgi:hypothetical protein